MKLLGNIDKDRKQAKDRERMGWIKKSREKVANGEREREKELYKDKRRRRERERKRG